MAEPEEVKAKPKKTAAKTATKAKETPPAPQATPAKKAAKATSSLKPTDVVEKYRTHEGDTGSVQVQVALLTKDISALAKHLTEHKKDHDSRRGLLKMVARRRRLLTALQSSDNAEYLRLIGDLGLRK